MEGTIDTSTVKGGTKEGETKEGKRVELRKERRKMVLVHFGRSYD
jgi:hypothetical protein